MSIKYQIFGIPQNIDEVVDLLKNREANGATVKVTETQLPGRIIHSATVELGPRRVLGDLRYVVDQRIVWLTPGSDGYHKFDESRDSHARVLAEAEKTRDYLTEKGIPARILESKEYLWRRK